MLEAKKRAPRMPYVQALRSSDKTSVAGVQAKWLFFCRPTGLASETARRYSATFCVKKSSEPNAKFKAPSPSRPTYAAESGLEQAANIGGCGFWTGFGRICVGAM